MEQTPLELYETAYKLHYQEHRIANAVTYYQRLIKEFPDANECGYAVIQLQKIKATEVAEDLSLAIGKDTKRGSAMPAVIIMGLLLLGAGAWCYVKLTTQISAEQHRVTLGLNALAKMSRGNHEDALALLSEMKMLKKDDIMPYELSADIFRKEAKFDKAQSEYTTFFRMNPTLQPTENERWFMQLGDSKKGKGKQDVKAPDAEEVQPAVPAVPSAATTRKVVPPRGKKKNAGTPPPPGKVDKSILLVDPDSISYF